MSQADYLTDFDILVSKNCIKHILAIDPGKRVEIYECLKDLVTNRQLWRNRKVKKLRGFPNSRILRTARINAGDRLLFEGPLKCPNSNRILFIHDFCTHDGMDTIAKKAFPAGSIQLVSSDENWECDDGEENSQDDQDIGLLDKEILAYSKAVSSLAFADHEALERILTSEKSNIRLSEKQFEVLKSPCPILINGKAGSGKSTILAHRMALSILRIRNSGSSEKILFLSYNRRLVEQAINDTRDILVDLHFEKNHLNEVEFFSLQEYLFGLVSGSQKYKNHNYINFGIFRKLYERYKIGNPKLRKIPSEVAWHSIRSIMKGGCIPEFDSDGNILRESRPPLSVGKYTELSKKRKDLEEELFSELHKVGEWYQKECIGKQEYWDDQDLAFEAICTMIHPKSRNHYSKYSEIYCDEVQDLTELEFNVLVSSLDPNSNGYSDGPPLILAGDPQQTINPTGFRWEVIGDYSYKLCKKSIARYELTENWRSDTRIVQLANEIDKVKNLYLNIPFNEQVSYANDGDLPQIIPLNHNDCAIKAKEVIQDLPPSTALIIWKEDSESILEFLRDDNFLNRIVLEVLEEVKDQKYKMSKEFPFLEDLIQYLTGKIEMKLLNDKMDSILKILDIVYARLNLYQVTDSKGLEFRLVILYKFAEEPDIQDFTGVFQGSETNIENRAIPLFYMLNRLYVSITRAESYLFIIDREEVLENFWRIWDKTIEFQYTDSFNEHIAFQKSLNREEWLQWGKKLLEKAETSLMIRDFQRAKHSFQKAEDRYYENLAEAHIQELNKDWKEAGHLFYECENYVKSSDCFYSGKHWEEALLSLQTLQNQKPESFSEFYSTRSYICKFYLALYNPNNNERANLILNFYHKVFKNEDIERKIFYDLSEALASLQLKPELAYLLKSFYSRYHDKDSYLKAAEIFQELKKWDESIEIYKDAKSYNDELFYSLKAKITELNERRETQKIIHLAKEFAPLFEKHKDRYAADLYRILGFTGDLEGYFMAGLAYYRIKEYKKAKKYFNLAKFKGKEYELCIAELNLFTEDFEISLKIFQYYKEYDRIISLKDKKEFSHANDQRYIHYLANALYLYKKESETQPEKLFESIDLFQELVDRSKDERRYSRARYYISRIADCYSKLDQNEKAYNYYLEGKNFKKAYELARYLEKDIKKIKYMEAEFLLNRKYPEFEKAIEIYHSLGDENALELTKAKKFENKKMYIEAAYAYMNANSPNKAKECLSKTKNRRDIARFKGKFGF